MRNGVTTNVAETFFSQLKRSVDGTHHHVSAKHLLRYLAEFDYRFSTRKLSDSARMTDLVSRTAGRRLGLSAGWSVIAAHVTHIGSATLKTTSRRDKRS